MAIASPSTAPAATQTRITSCAGWDFQPIDTRTESGWKRRMRFRIETGGDGWFSCPVALPHRAVVTRVRFTAMDGWDEVQLEFCGLVRVALAVGGDIEGMAFPIVRSGMGAAPGVIRRTDDSIEFATVDNGRFAYTLQCRIRLGPSGSPSGESAGVFGADVTYTIRSADG